ncbi:MAG TPA: hypothetical protein VFT12_07165 [Thermoanaerobaculia bacterium]|nr:hypothetical protein [Thermoanaerobaculia bacterium]
MIAPYPFSRAIYLYGEPFFIPRDGDVEEWRVRVESVLNELTAFAENNFDRLWEGEKG